LFWAMSLTSALKDVESKLSQQDMDMIIDAAIRMGAAIKEREIDRKYSVPLKSGLKRKDSLVRSSSAANAKKSARATSDHAHWKAVAQEIWRAAPHLSSWACARNVITRLSLKHATKTVADEIRDLAPKKVGGTG
jgi:hypothetical protein